MTTTLENGGIYNIVAKHSNKALDVTGAGTENGTKVNQFPVTAGYQWQRWKLQYYGDGAYKIIDMNSGKLMSISASSPYSNEVCHIWADDGTTGQLFRIRENRDGSYSLLSKCSNYQYVLSVGGGSTENGQIAYHAFDYGYDYQRFSFNESVADIDFILPVIEELYRYACEYAPNKSVSYRRQLVLHYIRHYRYNDFFWKIVAGSINEEYVAYVNSKNDLLDRMFVLSGYDNNTYHIINAAADDVVDSSGETVDFMHMCATLNAAIYSQTEVLWPISGVVTDLSGWGMDLITLVPETLVQLQKKGLEATGTNIYNEMYNVFITGGEKTKFSRKDLLADIDAMVIFQTLNNMKMESFDKYFKYHYEYNCFIRFSLFVQKNTYQDAWNIVDIYLRCENVLNAILEGYEKYKKTGEIPEGVYTVLVNLTQNLTKEQRNAITDAFVDYIWECIENEQA